MKKITSLIVVLLAAFGISAQTNLVKNPSFEADFADWKKGPINTYTDPVIKSGDAQAGNKYTEYHNPTKITGFYQEITVSAGQKYKLSFWYKASYGKAARIWSAFKDATNKIVYLMPTSEQDPLRNNNVYLPTTTAWTEHTVEFVAPAGAVSFQLAVRGYKNGTVSFDNFSLVAVEAVSPVINVNSASLSFTSAVGTASKGEKLTVSAANLSAAPTVTITGVDAAMFTYTGTLTATGGELELVFTPTSGGAKAATMTITGQGASATVELKGVATESSNPYGLDTSSPLASFKESFGNGNVTTPTLPSGWMSVALQGDRKWAVKAHSNNNYVQMSAFKGTGEFQTLLISPAINFDAIDKTNVKFNWKSAHTKPGTTLKVYVMKVDGTKTEVKSIDDNSNPTGYGAQFNTETLNLSTFTGVQFLVFEYHGEGSSKTTTYQVDDVIVNPSTSIFAPKFDKLVAWVSDGKVHFSATSGEAVEIYNAMGQKVFQALATDGDNEFAVPFRGIVIVKVGNRVGKMVF